MASSVKHAFESTLPDGADATLLQPSHWNAEHTITIDPADLVFTDPAYPTRSFKMSIAIRNEGTAEEYIETLWTEV